MLGRVSLDIALMAYPPRMRVYLLEFDLVRGYRCSQTIEYQETRTRCALVYCTYEGVLKFLLVRSGAVEVFCSVLHLVRIGSCHRDKLLRRLVRVRFRVLLP